MDLVTRVTACALTVDPKIMHALIWHQSGGEPWSFTVPGERQPQVYRNVADAIRAAHATYPADVAIRVGLTGLSASPRSATAAMFASCANITLAAQQIAQFAERCETSPRLKGDPICCAIAVRTSVANNDAPDFEMPKDASFDFADVDSATQPALHDTTTAPPLAPDDRQRGWSSAL